MDAAVKGLLYLGSILLVGAGATRYFVLPAAGASRGGRWLRAGAWTGALVVVAGSVLDIVTTLQGVLGSVDLELVRTYALNTRHGRAILVRFALVVVVLATTLGGIGRRERPDSEERPTAASAQERPSTLIAVGHALAALALLATFSWTSHAAAMGGTPPLLADLLHFAAAAVWAGPLLYLATQRDWSERQDALRLAFARVSRIGLASVLLLFLSGAYTALLHMGNPERFVASPYGFALAAKLLVVLVIVGIAAANRLWLLPAFLAGRRPLRFRAAVRTEAVLLVVVFLATGILTTSALPHEAGTQSGALANLGAFLRFVTGR